MNSRQMLDLVLVFAIALAALVGVTSAAREQGLTGAEVIMLRLNRLENTERGWEGDPYPNQILTDRLLALEKRVAELEKQPRVWYPQGIDPGICPVPPGGWIATYGGIILNDYNRGPK
jgi:hypothetical protein